MTGGSTNSPPTKEMKKVQYAQDNILQNYQYYVPEKESNSSSSSSAVGTDQYWIIYIHGGYFRDPKVDATSFKPALELLTSNNNNNNNSNTTADVSTDALATVPESTSPSPATPVEQTAAASRGQTITIASDLIERHVAGYVSINYRLSPHPEYPQDDTTTEDYTKRNARFPQQLNDIHAALRHLQTRFEITNNYILLGHSVGATLAFLAALKSKIGQIDPPMCVVGLNGIYDFNAIHKTNPQYEMMTSNAMNKEQYTVASPASYDVSEYAGVLPNAGMKILLSHSKDDGLVVWDQVNKIQETLKVNEEGNSPVKVELLETKGQHDEIWKEGKELARTVIKALQMVVDGLS